MQQKTKGIRTATLMGASKRQGTKHGFVPIVLDTLLIVNSPEQRDDKVCGQIFRHGKAGTKTPERQGRDQNP